MKKAYYAHPIAFYGTSLEEYDLKNIKKLGLDVVNPAGLEYDGDMDKYLVMVRHCDALFFRAFHDGKIGSGVALEIHAARMKKIPVFELPTLPQLKFRTLTRNETRARLGMGPVEDDNDWTVSLRSNVQK